MTRRTASIVAILIYALLAGTAGAAAPKDPQHPQLSPRLVRLADQGAASDQAQAQAVGLPAQGEASLLRHDDQPVVEIRFNNDPKAREGAVHAAGGEVLDVSDDYNTITAAVAPQRLRALASIEGVQSVTEVLTPRVAATCPSGAIVSEGSGQLNAGTARARFGLSGAGVTVGVLSDSYNKNSGAATNASTDVANADLPGTGNPCSLTTPVNVLSDPLTSAPTDEGRAMAQVVHDIAPGANLAFASGFNGEQSFADNIRALKDAGAKVIVDDLTYFDEPVYQDGPVSVAVNDVTAAGVTYFSAAGNDNVRQSGRDESSWEAPAFRNAGSCPSGLPSYANQCVDFDPSSGVDTARTYSIGAGQKMLISLQWAQPWSGVSTDLDLYIRSASGALIAKSENANAATTQKPFELLQVTNPATFAQTVSVSVNRYTGSGGGDAGTPRLRLTLLDNGVQSVFPTEYTSSSGGDVVGPTIFGHNGAANAVSAAAVPYNNSATPESFSSRGPVTLRFGPVSGSTPAPPLATPQVLAKPDLSATDCGVTSFFSAFDGSNWRFCGTSAAAPHAAGVAALEIQARPSSTVALLKSALRGSGRPVGTFGSSSVGSGLIDANAATAWLKFPSASLVRNLNTASGASSSPANFALIGSTLYFTANDGTHGVELFKSNGTTTGTTLVKDINPAAGVGSNPTWLTVVGTTLYFAANDGTHGTELYKSDGTAAGTTLVRDIRAGSAGSGAARLAAVGATLYLAADDGSHGVELYKSDGTASGTVLVKDIKLGTGGSFPQSLTAIGTKVYFVADDGSHGFELFSSNGTSVGTVLVKDINAASGIGSTPSNLTVVGSVLYFTADDGTHGRELYKSDGSSFGTVLVSDIAPGSASSSPLSLTRVGSRLFFSANDGTHGVELFRSDGTGAGTVLVADIVSGSGSSSPSSLAAIGTNTVYFAANDGTHGFELFRSDGTAGGTRLFKDINPSGNSTPRNLTNLNGTLVFTADDGTHGTELWRTEGTPTLTGLIRDIDPGSAGSFPAALTVASATRLYFTANDGTNGIELWEAQR
jgi:ELWxxDGT repeat protein